MVSASLRLIMRLKSLDTARAGAQQARAHPHTNSHNYTNTHFHPIIHFRESVFEVVIFLLCVSKHLYLRASEMYTVYIQCLTLMLAFVYLSQ